MSQWDDRIENHTTHSVIATILSGIELSESTGSATPESLEHLSRIRQVTLYLKQKLAKSDPALVTPQMLDNLSPHLNAIMGFLTQFSTDGNISHLANANAHCDKFLPMVATLPSLIDTLESDGARESVVSFRRSASQYLRHVEEKATEASSSLLLLQSQVDQTTTEVGEQKKRLDKAIAEFQSQFSAAEDRRRQEFQQLIDAVKQDSTSISRQTEQNITAMVQQITDLQQKHEHELDSIESRASEKLDTAFKSNDALVTSALEQWKEKAVETHLKLDKYVADASKLVHVIGNIGVTGNYQKSAASHKEIADRFRWIAISLMLCAGIAGLATVWLAVKEFHWQLTLYRMFATLVLLVPAYYAVRESDKHRRLETDNRRMELELASLDPFLERLPEDVRNELKSMMAKRYFGIDQELQEKREDVVSASSLLEVLQSIFQTLLKK